MQRTCLWMGMFGFLATRIVVAGGTGTITGTVREDGLALQGASVEFFPGSLVVSTDSSGRYTAEVPADVPVYLRVHTPRPERAFIGEETVKLSSGESRVVDFEFFPGTIQGTVTENGIPLTGAIIRFPGGVIGTIEVRTDGDGRYRQRVRSGIPQFIRVRAPDGAFIGQASITVGRGEVAQADFTFRPATIAGTVTERGVPLPGAELRFPGGIETIFIRTDSEGRYAQRVQSEVAQGVRVFTPDRRSIIGGGIFTLGLGEILTLDFDFVPCLVVGTVTQGGDPLQGARVRFNIGIDFVDTFTDESGEYVQRVQSGLSHLVTATASPGGQIIGQATIVCDGTCDGLMLDFPTTGAEVLDHTPPLISVPPDLVVECRGSEGTEVDLGQAAAVDSCSDVTITHDAPGVFPLGVTAVIWTAVDGHGNVATDVQTVTVVDTTPPVIESISADPNALWPPNHRMVDVAIAIVARDRVDPAPRARVLDISSNEPPDTKGDGRSAADWEITGELMLKLRAERCGMDEARQYRIRVACTDSSGNTAVESVVVRVAHDRSGGTRPNE